MHPKNNALIIFARKPELGKVKTRLAASIGDKNALKIYQQLLNHTKVIAGDAAAETHVFLTAFTDDTFWKDFENHLQEGDSLGDKMLHAFTTLFKIGYQHCVIIGSDCPSLTHEIVNDAFAALNHNDIVIGPAADGGYYLLGMNTLHTTIFENKQWSTNTVCSDTIEDAQLHQLTYFLLPTLNDVDEVTDVPAAWLAAL